MEVDLEMGQPQVGHKAGAKALDLAGVLAARLNSKYHFVQSRICPRMMTFIMACGPTHVWIPSLCNRASSFLEKSGGK